MIYETNDSLSKIQADEFVRWFNEEIGTDWELNPSASGEPDEYYIMFFDLEDDEYDKIADHEKLYTAINNAKLPKENR